jgi:hypothetical protein
MNTTQARIRLPQSVRGILAWRSRWRVATILLFALVVQMAAVGSRLPLGVGGASRAHAAGTPTITTVSFAGTGGLAGNVTVTVSGQNFGSTAPPAIPDNVPGSPVYDGYSGQNFNPAQQLAFTDDATTAPAPWSAGQSGNHIGLVLAPAPYTYTDSSIVFGFGDAYGTTFGNGFYLNAGDPFTVYVGGQSCSGIVDFNTPTSCSPPPPAITSVAFTGTTSASTVTVTGNNFGSQPAIYGAQPNSTADGCQTVFTGSNYGQNQYGFNDTSPTSGVPWVSGQATQSAGTCIGITFSSYSSTQVAFSFGSALGTNNWYLNANDTFTVFVSGAKCSGTISFTAPVSCNAPTPPPSPSLTLAETHPGTNAGTFGTTIFGQLSGATPSTSYTLTFYSAAACGAAGTQIGTASVQTDASGNASFSPTLKGTFSTAGTQITATVTDSSSTVSPLSPCIGTVQGNDSWDTATQLWPDSAAGSQTVTVPQSPTVPHSIYMLGQERWYDFPVQPGAQVHVSFDGQAGSVLSLHTDIRQLYNGLTNPSTASKVAADLAIQDAPSGYLPSGYLPSGYLPSGYLPSGYLPSGYLPSGYLPSGYLPSGYLPSGYLPSGYLPSGYLPSGYLPSGYLPSGYLPSGYLPSGYLPSGYLPGPYASVTRQSLMAIATSPTATTLNIDRNTWDLTGHLYIRVAGPVGAFTLTVSEAGGVCGGISPVSGNNGPLPTTSVNGAPPQSLILWDSTRWDPARAGDSPADVSTLLSKMNAFAGRSDVNGQVIDLSQFPRVVNANSQADSSTACPAAKNLVASEIKSIVQGYRDAYQANGKTTVKYVVLVGDDHSIPFFRYPDESGLAPENGYVPPVSDSSATQAGLRNNYVLGQDEYGSSTSIPRGDHAMPIPDIAVGRLVDTAAEASHMLDAYTATNGVITPGSALVTGYDFVADAAKSVSTELSAGINQAGCSATSSCVTPDQLIAKQGAPSGDPSIWTSDNLRQKLYGSRHDVVFLAGHFSAGNLLASDYSTQLSAAEVAASSANLTNSLVLALGCHGGLNLPGQDAVSGLSPSPDWTEAMAQKGATLLAATGYAYGDTVLTEYGERLFVDVAQQLRTGNGNMPIGVANVAAKQDYLNTHLDLGGIDEKTLLETTLYGLPMLQVNMPGQRLVASTSSSIVDSAPTVTAGPGAALGLTVGQTGGSTDIGVAPTTTLNTTQLTDTSGNAVTASWLTAASGVVAHPLDPVFPLQLYNATVPNQVLRGVGFRGGSFTDLPNLTPLTVAPSTETSVGHPAFFSNVFYPTQVWSANYFDTVDGLNGGITSLAVAPAQYKSSSPGSTSGTIRQFTDLKLRLYYLRNSDLARQISTGAALDSAPNIIGATSTRDTSGSVTFQVRVQNGQLPSGVQDLQDVWVTYNDPSSGATQWTSVDLAQDSSDPTLWTGTASGLSSDTVYMVQAANATGLVSLNTNNGAYFTVAPATPPPAPVAPALTIQSSSNSGAYKSSVTFNLQLTQGGGGLGGQPVAVQVGTQAKEVTTGSDGSATVTIPLALSPGTFGVTASYAGGTTYSGVSARGRDFTVTRAPTTLTLAPSAASATYSSSESTGIVATLQASGGGLAQKSVYFTIDNGSGGVTHRVAITDANGKAPLGTVTLPAGSYTVSAAFADAVSDPAVAYSDPNYQGSSSSPATLTIAKAVLTVTANDAGRIYGATNPAFSANITGLFNGDTSGVVSGSPSLTTVATASSSVGSYAITPAIGSLAAANYTFNFAPGTLTVGPAPLTITARDQTTVYGTTAVNLVTGAGTVGYIGFVNGDGAGSLSTPTVLHSSATLASPVSTYPISVDGATDANYTVTFMPGTLTVGKAPLTVTALNQSKVYGTTAVDLTNNAATVSYTGFKNEDDATKLTTQAVLHSTGTAGSGAGSYPITVDSAASGNYAITFLPGTLTVSSAPLTISADTKYMTVHAAVPGLTWTPTGLVNGDAKATVFTSPNTAPSCGTTATSASVAGSYTISCANAANPNYSISYVVGTLFVQYRFDGFLQPINDTGHTQACGSPCTLSVFKAGSNVPVKFLLKDVNGTVLVPGANAVMPVWLIPQDLGTTSAPISESTYTDTPTTGNLFTWDGSQYHFNWKSAGFTAGHIYLIGAILDDGEVVSVKIGLR